MSEKLHEGLSVVELEKLLSALVKAGVPATTFWVFVHQSFSRIPLTPKLIAPTNVKKSLAHLWIMAQAFRWIPGEPQSPTTRLI